MAQPFGGDHSMLAAQTPERSIDDLLDELQAASVAAIHREVLIGKQRRYINWLLCAVIVLACVAVVEGLIIVRGLS